MARGYHVYQSVWEVVNGEVLECSREIENRSEPYAVAVTKSSGEVGGRVTVGHVPRKISSICSIFIQHGGIIDCTVMLFSTCRYIFNWSNIVAGNTLAILVLFAKSANIFLRQKITLYSKLRISYF